MDGFELLVYAVLAVISALIITGVIDIWSQRTDKKHDDD